MEVLQDIAMQIEVMVAVTGPVPGHMMVGGATGGIPLLPSGDVVGRKVMLLAVW